MAVVFEYVVSFAARALRALAGERSGATAVEYGIIVAGISVTILAAVSLIGDEMVSMFNFISNTLDGVTSP